MYSLRVVLFGARASVSSQLKLSGRVSSYPPPSLSRANRYPSVKSPPALRRQLATGSRYKKPSEEIKEATARGVENRRRGAAAEDRCAPDAAHFYFRPHRYYSRVHGRSRKERERESVTKQVKRLNVESPFKSEICELRRPSGKFYI